MGAAYAAAAVVDAGFLLDHCRNLTSYGWDDTAAAYEHLDRRCAPFGAASSPGEYVRCTGALVREPAVGEHGCLEFILSDGGERIPCVDLGRKFCSRYDDIGMVDDIMRDGAMARRSCVDVWGGLIMNLQDGVRLFPEYGDDALLLNVFAIGPRDRGKDQAQRIYYPNGILNSEEFY